MATKLYYFTVYGCGDFPIDMLRHGRCWPLSCQDTSQIQSVDNRAITLCGLDYPDWNRWGSMGWREFDVQPFGSKNKR